ncbi:MAG: hypothetical protein KKE42_09760 [Alphaproteobacteria bacterium]|nr:hypothetical protein [Alphaproteobacteria bacterium]MBU3974069.1 hypothetical protein [Alphaproteobacteria bacterium]MBU4135315.1 hypothetical protein [Alphaproteobacteria bacterium]
MTTFQVAGLVFSILVFAAAWLQGGHPERFGVMVNLVCWLVSVFASSLTIGDMPVGVALADIGLTGVLVWMAMTGERWWPFAAAAFMLLTLMVYLSLILAPGLDQRADYAARLGLFICVVGTLLIGIAERWLAGEPPVSATTLWRPAARP